MNKDIPSSSFPKLKNIHLGCFLVLVVVIKAESKILGEDDLSHLPPIIIPILITACSNRLYSSSG